LTTGEIVEEGATVAEPVDQAFNLYLLLKIELPEATCTEVPGATTSVLGAVPEVAPAIVYETPISAPLHCAVKVIACAVIV
jgi:hypothetical protein